MLLQIQFESDLPIYLQIKQQIIQAIAKGELKPGDSLPSVRQLAADIGINLHTVNKAYDLLRKNSIIQMHRQKGAVISPQTFKTGSPDFLRELEDQLKPLLAEAFCLGFQAKQVHALVDRVYKEFIHGG